MPSARREAPQDAKSTTLSCIIFQGSSRSPSIILPTYQCQDTSDPPLLFRINRPRPQLVFDNQEAACSRSKAVARIGRHHMSCMMLACLPHANVPELRTMSTRACTIRPPFLSNLIFFVHRSDPLPDVMSIHEKKPGVASLLHSSGIGNGDSQS